MAENYPLQDSKIVPVNGKNYRVYSKKELGITEGEKVSLEVLKIEQKPDVKIKVVEKKEKPKSIRKRHFVGKNYIGKLYGARGATKKRIERESSCLLHIPSKEEASHFIEIEGRNKEEISKCIELIQRILPKYPPITHFISIRFSHSKKFKDLQSLLQKEFPKQFTSHMMFISERKLHFTLNLLTLPDDESVDKAKEIMEDVIQPFMTDLFEEKSENYIEYEGLDFFGVGGGKKPSAAKVLFLKPKHSPTLSKLKDLFTFIQNTFKAQEVLQKREENITFHSTVVNTKYARKRRKTFDATQVLNKYQSSLPEGWNGFKFVFKELELSFMGTLEGEKKYYYYPCVHRISF